MLHRVRRLTKSDLKAFRLAGGHPRIGPYQVEAYVGGPLVWLPVSNHHTIAVANSRRDKLNAPPTVRNL